jgi:hypothetical protein
VTSPRLGLNVCLCPFSTTTIICSWLSTCFADHGIPIIGIP